MFDGDDERGRWIAVGPQGNEVIVMLIVNRPERCAVGFGEGECVDGFAREEAEAPFGHGRWKRWDGAFAIEEKEQPVVLPLVGFLGDHGEEVQIARFYHVAGFLGGLARGAFEWGFPDGGFEFAADGAPRAEIGWFGAQQQQVFALVIFNEYKDGDFMGGRGAH